MKHLFLILSLTLLCLSSCEKLDPSEAGNLVPKTVMEDPTLPSLQLSSTKVHYQTFGHADSTKVFLLAGGPGGHFGYLLGLKNAVNGWLPEHYQVIYFDHRGCGLSQRHPTNELSMANMLMDLEEVIDHFAPNEQVILIGHSHGGTLAAQYLNAHPDRVKGAIFVEPGPFSSTINKNLARANSANAINYFGEDINQLIWLKQLVAMDNHEKADYMMTVIAANVNSTARGRGEQCPIGHNREGAAITIAVAIDEVSKGSYDYTTNLNDYTSEVLFISSSQTEDIGYDFQETHQVPLFSNAIHIEIEGTGHTGLVNCTKEETLTAIKNYLNRL